MTTIIVAGGELRSAYLKDYLTWVQPDYLIAVDRGLDVLMELGGSGRFKPDLIVGDFDSTGRSFEEIKGLGSTCEKLPREKDLSDLEYALKVAVERACDGEKDGSGEEPFHCEPNPDSRIIILGATGGRLDHFLANVMDLQIPLEAGIRACIVDENNVIFLKDQSFQLSREYCFGKYVSLLPLTEESVDVTLKGFKYSGEHIVLKRGLASHGISNEIVDAQAEVIFEGAVMIVVESR